VVVKKRPSGPSRVLVLQEKSDDLGAVCAALRAAGFIVEEARRGGEARTLLDALHPQVVITDLVLDWPGGSGFLRELRRRGGDGPRVIFLTDDSTESEVLSVLKLAPGVQGWLRRGARSDDLIEAVRAAFEAYSA